MSFQAPSQNYVGFDPRQFAGLFLWNDAQQITGIANGATLTNGSWSNLAEDTRFKYIGACSTGATYQTNVLNGLPVMRFTTAQEYRFHSSVVALNDCSLFFVTRLTGTTNSRIFQSSNLNLLYGYWGGWKNSFWLENNPGLLSAPPAIAANTSWDVYSMYASEKGPYTFNNFGSTIIMGATSYRPAFSGLCINSGGYSNEDSTCEVAEVLAYSNALPLNQSRAVEGYLSWKWGLQSSLPNFHPFKNAPPFMQAVRPLDMSFPPLIWIDAQYTPYERTTGTLLDAFSTLGTSGVNFTRGTNIATFGISTGRVNQASINGFSTITFNTGTTACDNMAYIGGLTSNNRSIFTINRCTSALGLGGENNFLQVNTGVGGMEHLLFRTTPGGVYQVKLVKNGTGDIVAANLSQNPQNVINIFATVFGNNTSYNKITENGTVSALTANTTNTFVAGTNYLYNRTGNTGQNLGEYVYFEYDVSPAERQMMEGYLAWKWRQTSAFPALHPFKNYPPVNPFFSPLNINSCNTTSAGRGPLQCVLWMDAAQEGGANGSFVNSITDKSGSGFTLTASAANSVTLVTPGLNSRPYYNIGTNRFSTASFVWRTKYTCAVVVNGATGRYGHSLINNAFTTYSNYLWQGNWGMHFVSGSLSNGTWEDSATAQNVSVVGGTGWNICIWQYNNTGNPGWRLNGSSRTVRLTGGSGANDQSNTAVLWINGGTGGAFDSGVQVAEILHYNDFLSNAQLQQLEGYLAWKWGLVSKLPGNHAYKTMPP